jgi:cell division protein FtsQ
MDGGGCLDQPLTRSGPVTAEEFGAPAPAPRRPRGSDDLWRGVGAPRAFTGRFAWPTVYRRRIARWRSRIMRLPPPPGLGIAASILLLAATLGYGAVAGDHLPVVIDWMKDMRDAAANATGFRIAAISLTGPKEVSREEVLTVAGVTGRASLLFLDADAARTRLLENPWIADAAVLKLYPDRLQITITERRAFALWQQDRRVGVIAADGTVLEPFVEDRYVRLPLVVGRGAERRAKDFLAILDRYPDIRSQLRASIMVADRRWNLRLKNGIDVRLPETNVEQALDRLVALDREKKILSRDILAIDLRLPDRVTVRLSDVAAAAREEALKDKRKKKGGEA